MKPEVYYENFLKSSPTEEDLLTVQCSGVASATVPPSPYACLLAFNAETACCWGGPYPGNYAVAFVMDPSKKRGVSVDCSLESCTEFRKTLYGYLQNSPGYSATSLEDISPEYPTQELPIAIYVHGTDDTSFVKYMRSEEEAEALLRFLEEIADASPLDFHKDFLPFGFVP